MEIIKFKSIFEYLASKSLALGHNTMVALLAFREFKLEPSGC